MPAIHIAASDEGQLFGLHARSGFADDLKATTLWTADADNAHRQGVVGGRLFFRCHFLSGQQLLSVPVWQPCGG